MKSIETFFWKLFPFMLLLIPLSAIALIINHYDSLVPRENIKQALGTVIGYTKGSNKLAIVAFKKNKKEFSARISSSYVIGEKFVVEYEENNPSKNRARLDIPIFIREENTATTVAIVNRYNPNYFRELSFIYFVDGEKYEQSYKPVEDSELKYPDLKEAQKYEVLYWVENPKRSILLLDQPSREFIPVE